MAVNNEAVDALREMDGVTVDATRVHPLGGTEADLTITGLEGAMDDDDLPGAWRFAAISRGEDLAIVTMVKGGGLEVTA